MVRSIAFLLAFILYGLLSSPTPDELGWVEYSIGGLLLMGVGLGAFALTVYGPYPASLQYHRVFFFYMLSVPLMVGVVAGYGYHDILRDILPVLCLALPLLFYIYPQHKSILVFGGVFIGAMFAMRYGLNIFPEFYQSAPLLYLANSPLVPFATMMGFHYLSHTDENTSWVLRGLGLGITLLGLIAMTIMMQRAPLGLTVIACAGIWMLRLSLQPILMVGIAIVIGATAFIFQNHIADVFVNLSYKTMTVGWNNRLEEFQAVMMQSSLWGQGWGAMWQSPAVADIWVRYTHNIISYYWLKAGLVGAGLAVGFVIFWGWQIMILIRHKPAIGFAVAVPFLIHVTLYTGFKTLDFAILLALAVTLCPAKPAHANQS